MIIRTSIIVLAGLAISTSAYAGPKQSKKDKKAQLDGSHKLEKAALDFNEALGAKVVASIDWKSFKDSDWKSRAMGSYCASPLKAIEDMSKGPKVKQYAKSNLTKLVCKYRGKSKTKMSIKGKTMTWFVDFDVSDSRGAVLKHF